jgi:hypothetical protein
MFVFTYMILKYTSYLINVDKMIVYKKSTYLFLKKKYRFLVFKIELFTTFT